MADAGDLYDEFGNYIGPELSESEEVRWRRGQPAASLPAHVTAAPCLRVAVACAAAACIPNQKGVQLLSGPPTDAAVWGHSAGFWLLHLHCWPWPIVCLCLLSAFSARCLCLFS